MYYALNKLQRCIEVSCSPQLFSFYAFMDDSPVPTDAAGRPKGLAAITACEGPLVSVGPLMDPQYIERVEPFPARFALVFPLVGVVNKMAPILSQYVKSLSAHLTRLLRRRIMDRPVYHQTAFEFEPLLA